MASHTSTFPLLGFKQVQWLFPSEQCLAGNKNGSVPLCFSHSPQVSAPCPQLAWVKWIPCSRQCSYQAVLCPVLFCTVAGETLSCTAHCDESSLCPTRGAASWQTRASVGLHSLGSAALLCPEDLKGNQHPQHIMSKSHVRIKQSSLSHKCVRNWPFPSSASGLLQCSPKLLGNICTPTQTELSLWLP